jgi:hypothetical protein
MPKMAAVQQSLNADTRQNPQPLRLGGRHSRRLATSWRPPGYHCTLPPAGASARQLKDCRQDRACGPAAAGREPLTAASLPGLYKRPDRASIKFQGSSSRCFHAAHKLNTMRAHEGPRRRDKGTSHIEALGYVTRPRPRLHDGCGKWCLKHKQRAIR